MARARNDFGSIRELAVAEADLHCRHLLRLDPFGRRERFNGVADDRFVAAYSARCFSGRIRVFAFVDAQGAVRGAAELHPPQGGEPADVAFSVEPEFRRMGIGTRLFEAVMAAARYSRFPELRITSTAENRAMRGLARKFGAAFVFEAGEVTGILDVAPQLKAPRAVRAPLAASSPELV